MQVRLTLSAMASRHLSHEEWITDVSIPPGLLRRIKCPFHSAGLSALVLAPHPPDAAHLMLPTARPCIVHCACVPLRCSSQPSCRQTYLQRASRRAATCKLEVEVHGDRNFAIVTLRFLANIKWKDAGWKSSHHLSCLSAAHCAPSRICSMLGPPLCSHIESGMPEVCHRISALCA